MKPQSLKNYQVKLVAYTIVVVVGAKDEEEAIEFAKDEISCGSFEIDEEIIEKELKTDKELEAAKRHAHAISEEE